MASGGELLTCRDLIRSTGFVSATETYNDNVKSTAEVGFILVTADCEPVVVVRLGNCQIG